jgi:hypothetical protein
LLHAAANPSLREERRLKLFENNELGKYLDVREIK